MGTIAFWGGGLESAKRGRLYPCIAYGYLTPCPTPETLDPKPCESRFKKNGHFGEDVVWRNS